jgi:hypothetical protein
MKHKQLSSDEGARTIAAVFETDDDVLPLLEQLCEREGIASAKFSAIGGFRSATVAFYDLQARRYEPIAVHEQVEVISLLGNVTQYEGKPKIHAHCVLGHRDGHTTGGHFLSGIVRPTLELFIEELPQIIQRTDRPEIGIPLIDLE